MHLHEVTEIFKGTLRFFNDYFFHCQEKIPFCRARDQTQELKCRTKIPVHIWNFIFHKAPYSSIELMTVHLQIYDTDSSKPVFALVWFFKIGTW